MLQDDEARRYRQDSEQLQKEKEALVVAHALEMEQLTERQQLELKRNRAVLDVKLREEIVRMKHLHEQVRVGGGDGGGILG